MDLDSSGVVVVVVVIFWTLNFYCCLLYLLIFHSQVSPALPSPSTHSFCCLPGLALPLLREREHLTVSASNVTAKYCNSSKYQDRLGANNKYQSIYFIIYLIFVFIFNSGCFSIGLIERKKNILKYLSNIPLVPPRLTDSRRLTLSNILNNEGQM